ncbi:MAG: hypothetical protein AAFN30_14075, partial [Actinomycetota bacterium]
MELSDRSIGWLRYLDRKAHTPDDWSREGRPHPHWDDRSDPPMASWHRFDLVDSSYAMGLLAHRTLAWTERYVAILDQLIERHTGWWSAADWLTQFGPDPDRDRYPDEYRPFIPRQLWGQYDVPGWTANGIEPYGVQMDPVAADGMLFYKGFFLVLLGIRSMVTPDERWNEPFEMVGDVVVGPGEGVLTVADHFERLDPALVGRQHRTDPEQHQEEAIEEQHAVGGHRVHLD